MLKDMYSFSEEEHLLISLIFYVSVLDCRPISDVWNSQCNKRKLFPAYATKLVISLAAIKT